jgi:AraC-like DNA-binding protein
MNTKLNHIKNWEELAQKANWSAQKLAKDCNVSSRTLERFFLETKGKTPKNWLIEYRQQEAQTLLISGLSIKETAVKLGYLHPHHFSREFKKFWGNAPTQLSEG